jgi:phosphocarrier protein HPr
MPVTEVTVINKLGLHARAAAKLVRVAVAYPCKVKLGLAPDTLVDGKNIMAVMMLAAGKGTQIHLHTEGDKEDVALNALIELFNNRFDEGE